MRQLYCVFLEEIYGTIMEAIWPTKIFESGVFSAILIDTQKTDGEQGARGIGLSKSPVSGGIRYGSIFSSTIN